VADTHEEFKIDKMEDLKINISDGREINIFYSTNKYNCKFIHIKSSKLTFMEDLRDKIFSKFKY